MNISKELFEAVTGEISVQICTDKTRIWDRVGNRRDMFSSACITRNMMSYNDFFFKCKEWAYKNGYDIWSITWGACEVHDIKAYSTTKRFDADSEQQAVFDACQWILENK